MSQTRVETAAVTVFDLLALPVLAGARVAAGAEGLGRVVEYIDIMESWEGCGWLKPNDFLLTTAFPIADDPEAMRGLVGMLHRKNVSALGIKTGRFLKSIPDYMCEEADELGLPILELSCEAVYAEMIRSVSALIIDRQSHMLRVSHEVNLLFSDLMSNGGTLDDITEELARIVGCSVIMENEHLQILSMARHSDCPADEHSLLCANRAAKRRMLLEKPEENPAGQAPVHFPAGEGQPDLLVAPVAAGGRHLGFVTLAGAAAASPMGRMALQQVTVFTALELVARQTIHEKERYRRHTILNDLLYGVPCGDEYLNNWLAQIHWSADTPCIAGVIRPSPARREGVKDAIQALARAAESLMEEVLLVSQRDQLVLIQPLHHWYPGGKEENIRPYYEVLAEKLQKRLPETPFKIGVGGVCGGLKDIRDSYGQAAEALEIGERVCRENAVLCYSEMDLYRILTHHPNPDDLRIFSDKYVGALDNVKKFKFDALETLEVYIMTGRSLEKSSARLYAHKNTVKYRMAKIKEALGNPLDDPQYLCNLQLALLIRKLIGPADAPETARSGADG